MSAAAPASEPAPVVDKKTTDEPPPLTTIAQFFANLDAKLPAVKADAVAVTIGAAAVAATATAAVKPTTIRRGALIVIEGLDRSGKTTQCEMLLKRLNDEKAGSAISMKFPDRETPIGMMIDAYLKKKTHIPPEALHLLFAANRWERLGHILKALDAGQHVILDRYFYSGIAYSHAKGLDFNWCVSRESGLPMPDLTVFLDIKPAEAKTRSGFGKERYETEAMQTKIAEAFDKLRLNAYSADQRVEWDVLDGSKSAEWLHEVILMFAHNTIDLVFDLPLQVLG